MTEPVMHREKAIGLLFNVSDIAAAFVRIERLLQEDDDGEEEENEG